MSSVKLWCVIVFVLSNLSANPYGRSEAFSTVLYYPFQQVAIVLAFLASVINPYIGQEHCPLLPPISLDIIQGGTTHCMLCYIWNNHPLPIKKKQVPMDYGLLSRIRPVLLVFLLIVAFTVTHPWEEGSIHVRAALVLYCTIFFVTTASARGRWHDYTWILRRLPAAPCSSCVLLDPQAGWLTEDTPYRCIPSMSFSICSH